MIARNRPGSLPLLLALCHLAWACSDDPATTGEGMPDLAMPDGARDGAAPEDMPPADDGTPDAGTGPDGFVLCGVSLTPDGASSFTTTIEEFSASTEVDLGRAREIDPLSACVSQGRVLFIGSGERPEITRFTIEDDGTLTEGDTVSFMSRGVSTISLRPGRLQIVSDTKAYYLDDTTLEAVIWNPTTMQITGFVDLGELAPPAGATFGFSPTFQLGGAVLSAGGTFDATTGLANRDMTIFSIDAATDALTVVRDTRCGGGSNTSVVAADDGFVYFASGARTAARHRLGIEGTFPPCLLRFDPSTNQFDEGFFVEDLNTLTDSATTGELALGPDGSLLLLGYDESLVPITDEATDGGLLAAPAWAVYELASGTATSATRVGTLPPTSGAIATAEVDGTLYYVVFGPAFSATTFVNIDDLASPVDGLSSPGALQYFAPF